MLHRLFYVPSRYEHFNIKYHGRCLNAVDQGCQLDVHTSSLLQRDRRHQEFGFFISILKFIDMTNSLVTFAKKILKNSRCFRLRRAVGFDRAEGGLGSKTSRMFQNFYGQSDGTVRHSKRSMWSYLFTFVRVQTDIDLAMCKDFRLVPKSKRLKLGEIDIIADILNRLNNLLESLNGTAE